FHPPVLSELCRLEENVVGNTDFADVVQQRATLNVHKLVLRDADLARHQQRVVTDSLGVSLSLMFTSIQGTDERFKRMSVGTLDLAQCCLQIRCLLLDSLFQMRLILPILQNELPAFQGHEDLTLEFGDRERLGEIVVSSGG